MFKKIQCLQFSYDGRSDVEEIELDSKIQFRAQSPIDETRLERAILVKFDASGDDEKFKIGCLCRVVFAFSSPEELIEGNELLRLRQAEAYTHMTDLVNKTLAAMGQNAMDFPEL